MKSLFLCLGLLLFFLLPARTQSQVVLWDGGGGDSLWSNPINWSNDQLPTGADDVQLNNQWVAGPYTVLLPGGAQGVTVRSIQITPSNGQSIELILPQSLVVAPALTVNGAPGIVVGPGGVLRNISGAPSGNTIVLGDSLRLLNGGRYIHQTETGHASLLGRLSRAPETAEGVFQFDVPGPASYTLSVSNRTYGTLMISAVAAGGSKTYLSSGSNPLQVRGDLILDTGVTYAMNFSGGSRVMGDLVVNGTLNLSSGVAHARCVINGGIQGKGLITETGTGTAIVEMGGVVSQWIAFTGHWQQQVELQLTNPQGLQLREPLLLPYRLQLINGRLETSAAALLTLGANARIQADSNSSTSFIHGPLFWKGLHRDSLYLFPVGKGDRQRWIRMQKAEGDFRIEYFRNSPYSLATQLGEGLNHISAMEYWKVETDSPLPFQTRVSFELNSSGGVTDLQTLRVARLRDTIWEDVGNTEVTGSAGSSGSVTSALLSDPPHTPAYFTLASSASAQNPLPDYRIWLKAVDQGTRVMLIARIAAQYGQPVQFEYSDDGLRFSPLPEAPPALFPDQFVGYDSSRFYGKRMYRVHTRHSDGRLWKSEIAIINRLNKSKGLQMRQGAWAPAGPHFVAEVPVSGSYVFNVLRMNGLLLSSHRVFLHKGTQKVSLPISGAPAGIYQIIEVSYRYRSTPLRLMKF